MGTGFSEHQEQPLGLHHVRLEWPLGKRGFRETARSEVVTVEQEAPLHLLYFRAGTEETVPLSSG